MSVSKLRLGTLRVAHRASCVVSWSILPLSIHLIAENYLVYCIRQLTSIETRSYRIHIQTRDRR